MMEDGEIKEQGTHDALIGMKGKYAEMFKLQAEKYRQGNVKTVVSLAQNRLTG